MTTPHRTTLGIVGGGQLGRMLAMAAARLDIGVVILDPDPAAPAAQVANEMIVAPYDDVAALGTLSDRCDWVTYEFENVPAAGLDALNAKGKLRPGPEALAVSQDRLNEKKYLNAIGLQTAPYQSAESADELAEAVAAITSNDDDADVDPAGIGAIVKTRRLGYDGKGQLRVNTITPLPDDAYESLGSVPLIVEGFVSFACELSVIGARSADGTVRCYEPARNTHTNGVLTRSMVPADAPSGGAEEARKATERLLESLEYVGVMGVEFFVLADGSVVVNEFAPRVHNSGHWTEAACSCSQFEQHVRAVVGRPLGDPRRHSDAEMINLLGSPDTTAGEADHALNDRIGDLLGEGDWMVHLYGKVESRPGRKMGHATRLTARTAR